jgi:DNA-binding MarR family transcriptional regulator
VQVTDPRAMRAMAHPLRLDLIELLGTVGPSTAAECARRLGSTQASCSFHLRQLAKYGFVQKAEPRDDARERPWQLTDIEQRWSSSEGGAAAAELERVFVQREADRIMAWPAAAEPDPSWRDSAFVGGATVPLTSEELAEVRNRLRQVLDPYVARLGDPASWPEGHRFVRLFIAGTPTSTSTSTPDPEGADHGP